MNGRQKIKLAILIDVLEDIRGGAERQVYELLKRMDRSRFEPYLYILHQGNCPQEIVDLKIFYQGLDLKRIYDLKGVAEGFKFVSFLRSKKIDIVLTYHFASDIWGTIFSRLAKVPVVISCRRDTGFWRNRGHIWTYRFVNRWVSKIITVSEAVRRVVIAEERVESRKVQTIRNGIDMERFEVVSPRSVIKERLGLSEIDKVVVCVANFDSAAKGHRYLIEAMKSVVEKHPDVKLLLVGDGPLRERLESQVSSLKLEDRVKFLGKRGDIADILTVSDICVLPSLSEGLSNALLEYMAAGKSCIASDVGGNPEVVQDQINGLLFPSGNVCILADRIAYLLVNPEERARLGSRGRSMVLENFSIQGMVSQYEKAFLSLSAMARTRLTRSAVRTFLKKAFCFFLYRGGIIWIIRWLRRGSPIVLCYHRVVRDFDLEAQYSLPGLLVSENSFTLQMEFLKKYFNPVSLDDYLLWLADKKKIPDYSVLVTFDDGYRDNCDVAYPIMKRLDIPMLIFVATSFMDQTAYPSWERPRASVERLMLSWDEIIEMSNRGVVFGAHTVSHLEFEQNNANRFSRELKDSKDLIETKIGRKVTVFAYPRGICRADPIDILKNLGFECGFCLIDVHRQMVRTSRNCFIPRISINEGMYVDPNGIFSESMFFCGILGIFNFARDLDESRTSN